MIKVLFLYADAMYLNSLSVVFLLYQNIFVENTSRVKVKNNYVENIQIYPSPTVDGMFLPSRK